MLKGMIIHIVVAFSPSFLSLAFSYSLISNRLCLNLIWDKPQISKNSKIMTKILKIVQNEGSRRYTTEALFVDWSILNSYPFPETSREIIYRQAALQNYFS